MKYFVTAICLMVASFSSIAKADGWTFCDGCATKAQFQNAAVGWMTHTGDEEVEVGNRVTGVVYRVSVSASQNPGVPAAAPVAPMTTSSTVAVNDTGVVNDSVDISQTQAVGGPLYVTVNWSLAESAQFNLEFMKMVSLYKKEAIWVPAPPGDGGFGSFSGMDQESVDNLVFLTYTSANPSWQHDEINGNLLESLMNALEIAMGKGPTVCVVFNNGDSACFQLNPIDPRNAIRYINGTAKDANGHKLPDSPGGVGGGGSFSTTVQHSGVDVLLFTTPGSAHWLSCGYVGGVLIECTEE